MAACCLELYEEGKAEISTCPTHHMFIPIVFRVLMFFSCVMEL